MPVWAPSPRCTASAAPQADKTNEPRLSTPSDALPNPTAEKQNALREEAIADVLSGEAKPQTVDGNSVLKVGREPAAARKARGAEGEEADQYVELSNERTDQVFVFLVEFGNQRHPSYPDQDTDPAMPGPTSFDGPGFNEIPEPGPRRQLDRWEPDYSKEYYENLYFGEGAGVESLKTYYERQSSGRYSVEGMVTDWSRRSLQRGALRPQQRLPVRQQRVQQHLEPGPRRHDAWVADQKAAGKTDAQIKAHLATYDVWDRYDYDGDGNFDEPDGYIDRFQIVHAGGDQADGDPIQGEDAIWSHRWTRTRGDRRTGPESTRPVARRSAPPASGSPTTPSSPRTAACRSLPTSTATTSASPTTTTPLPRATTRSAGGR